MEKDDDQELLDELAEVAARFESASIAETARLIKRLIEALQAHLEGLEAAR